MAVFDNLNKTTSPGVAPSVQEYYDATLQRYLMPNLVHATHAQKVPLPKHNGKQVRFRKPTRLAPITTPLESGVTPAGQTIEMTDFRVEVSPYGGHIELTDEANFFLLDDTQKMSATLLSDQARLSLDTILRNAYNTGTNVFYAGGKTSRAVLTSSDVLTSEELKKIVRFMEMNSVPKFSDGFYRAIIGPQTKYDLTDDPLWTDVAKYQNTANMEKYEVGRMLGIKFLETPNSMVFKPETNLFGSTASLTVSAVDAANRKLTITANHALITPYVARQLVGKLVDVKASSAAATQESVAIERVVPTDGTNAFIYLRWWPQTTMAANAVIVPTGGGASGMPVHSTLVYGDNAIGSVSLGGKDAVRIIINPPGSSGALDPIAQRATVAWKAPAFCGAILDDLRICRIEHGVSG